MKKKDKEVKKKSMVLVLVDGLKKKKGKKRRLRVMYKIVLSWSSLFDCKSHFIDCN